MAIVSGEKIRLVAKFYDSSGTLTDPGTPVNISIKDPDNSLVVEDDAATKDSTGVFKYTYTVPKAGRYRWKVKSNDGAIELGSFEAGEDRVG